MTNLAARPHNGKETLGGKGRQTRQAIEQAARELFTHRGFHGTTLSDITSTAGKSPASFYRYFTDKEDLLAALAESFLQQFADLPHLPDDGDDFFGSAVRLYWDMLKPNVGVLVALRNAERELLDESLS